MLEVSLELNVCHFPEPFLKLVLVHNPRVFKRAADVAVKLVLNSPLRCLIKRVKLFVERIHITMWLLLIKYGELLACFADVIAD